MDEKRCNRCLLTKPTTEFYRAAAGQRFPDGYRSLCKTCTKQSLRRHRRAITSTFACPVCGNPLLVGRYNTSRNV